MNKTKVIQSLGLCKRANKLVSGETGVLDRIRKQTVYLVFLASDAKKNTTKRIRDKSSFYKVKLIDSFTTEELNRAIGTNNRKVIGITDRNFTKMIELQLEQ